MAIKGFYKIDYEDWYGVCATGLCKAARTYKPNMGATFGTYAFKCMEREVANNKSNYMRHYIPTVSLSETVDGSESLTYDALISVEEKGFKKVDFEDFQKEIEDVYESLSPLSAAMCRMIFEQDATQQEVAEAYNVTRQRVNQVYRQFLRMARSKLIKNNITSSTGEII